MVDAVEVEEAEISVEEVTEDEVGEDEEEVTLMAGRYLVFSEKYGHANVVFIA